MSKTVYGYKKVLLKDSNCRYAILKLKIVGTYFGSSNGSPKMRCNKAVVVCAYNYVEGYFRSQYYNRKYHKLYYSKFCRGYVRGKHKSKEFRSIHENSFTYNVGSTVVPIGEKAINNGFECGPGIHFFLNIKYAIKY